MKNKAKKIILFIYLSCVFMVCANEEPELHTIKYQIECDSAGSNFIAYSLGYEENENTETAHTACEKWSITYDEINIEDNDIIYYISSQYTIGSGCLTATVYLDELIYDQIISCYGNSVYISGRFISGKTYAD